MVLYELLTKLSPLPAEMGALQLAHKILHEDLRPPLPDDLPDPYRQLILATWQRGPEKRPDFTECLNHLRALKASLPPSEGSAWREGGGDLESSSTSESLGATPLWRPQQPSYSTSTASTAPAEKERDPVVFLKGSNRSNRSGHTTQSDDESRVPQDDYLEEESL